MRKHDASGVDDDGILKPIRNRFTGRLHPENFAVYEENFYRSCGEFIKGIYLAEKKRDYSEATIIPLSNCLNLISHIEEKLSRAYVELYSQEKDDAVRLTVFDWLTRKGNDPFFDKYGHKIEKLKMTVEDVKAAASKLGFEFC